jgi:hypothetical protein
MLVPPASRVFPHMPCKHMPFRPFQEESRQVHAWGSAGYSTSSFHHGGSHYLSRTEDRFYGFPLCSTFSLLILISCLHYYTISSLLSIQNHRAGLLPGLPPRKMKTGSLPRRRNPVFIIPKLFSLPFIFLLQRSG